MGKVKFNIKNVHYAPITVTQGVVSYGTPVALPGARSIALEPNDGDNEIFYADGEEYYVQTAKNAYEGDLEMALIDDAFRKAIYGETVDEDDLLWESQGDEPKKFALGFEIEGSDQTHRFWFLNCSATKPSVSANTNEENKTVGTDTITIKCAPNADGHIRVKNTASTSADTLEDWFDAVISTPSN